MKENLRKGKQLQEIVCHVLSLSTAIFFQVGKDFPSAASHTALISCRQFERARTSLFLEFHPLQPELAEACLSNIFGLRWWNARRGTRPASRSDTHEN